MNRRPLTTPETSISPAAAELIDTHAEIARSTAARYRNRGVDLDDLEQVALLGLVKAAQRFDPEAGHEFMSFAIPTIRGEVRRHFRDLGWAVRPPRRLQELQARVFRATEQLQTSLGRSPRPTEIAAHLDEPLGDVTEALSLDGCFTPASLDLPAGEGVSPMASVIGGDDPDLGRTEARIVLEPVVRALPDRDRRIVHMRFYEDRSQNEIATAVGLTQAQVSRILIRILHQLRADIGDPGFAA